MNLFAAAPLMSLFVFFSLTAPSLAAPEDCEFIAESYAKLVDVPYRQVMTTDGKAQGEFISINNMLYAKVTDTWSKMPYAEPARRANMNQLFDKLKINECTKQPNGEHAGKAMRVYSYIVPPMAGFSTEPSTQTIYIGSDDGLPYLMKADTMQVELNFENITAPAE